MNEEPPDPKKDGTDTSANFVADRSDEVMAINMANSSDSVAQPIPTSDLATEPPDQPTQEEQAQKLAERAGRARSFAAWLKLAATLAVMVAVLVLGWHAFSNAIRDVAGPTLIQAADKVGLDLRNSALPLSAANTRSLLYADSTPDEATVFVNGEERGLTPAALDLRCTDLPWEIEVRKPGYRPWLHQLVCKPNTNYKIHTKLKRASRKPQKKLPQ